MPSYAPFMRIVHAEMRMQDIQLTSGAHGTYTTYAVCMTERSWSKFGNSRTAPDMHRTTLKKHTRLQNSAFSPALNRPDGTWCPLFESMPPKVLIQSMS